MRREYEVAERGAVDMPPFADNLVFWAPLDNGDVTDHISGKSPSSDSGCGYEWDENKGMYLLHAVGSSSSCYTALKYSNLNLFENGHEHTLVIDVDENNSWFSSTYTNRYNIMIGSPIRTSSNGVSTYICHYRYSTSYTPMVGTHRYVMVVKSGTWKFYKDGVLITSLSSTGVSNGKSVAICQLNTNNSRNYIWAKNARIYNKAFSDEEVRQL